MKLGEDARLEPGGRENQRRSAPTCLHVSNLRRVTAPILSFYNVTAAADEIKVEETWLAFPIKATTHVSLSELSSGHQVSPLGVGLRRPDLDGSADRQTLLSTPSTSESSSAVSE